MQWAEPMEAWLKKGFPGAGEIGDRVWDDYSRRLGGFRRRDGPGSAAWEWRSETCWGADELDPQEAWGQGFGGEGAGEHGTAVGEE